MFALATPSDASPAELLNELAADEDGDGDKLDPAGCLMLDDMLAKLLPSATIRTLKFILHLTR